MTDKLTDLRGKFFVVEDAAVTDYGLTPYEGWLYIVMLKHANRGTGELFPSVQTLVKETQMSKAQVLRCTKSLEAKGLIRVTRDEKKNGKDRVVNHYFILQATRYLPDTDPGIYQTPTPVSTRDMNQNQFEPEKDSPDGGTPFTSPVKKSRPPHKNAPWHDELLKCFGLTTETVTKTADKTYWVAAADLAGISFPVEKIAALHKWCIDEDWGNFTVMALAKYAGEWLTNHQNGGDDPYTKMFETMDVIGGKPWEKQV